MNKNNNNYISVNNEMCFPNPKGPELVKLIDHLSYVNELNFTIEQRYLIRDIIMAYNSILCHPARNLENTRKLIRDIRKTLNEQE